jgi:dTDP-4-amino-4,6-dideoxygalactose transaminase
MKYLANKGIGTRPPTHAIHTLSYYKEKYKIKSEEYPRAWAVNLCGFSLPIFPGLTFDDQDFVINKIIDYLK